MTDQSQLGDKTEATAADEVPMEADAETPASDHEEVSPDVPNKHWYVIHTYSGYENRVKTNIERRVESMDMGDKIFRVMVPTEEKVDFKDGKKHIVKQKIFPGYVLVEMVVSDDSWYVVRNTPGVTGFVGAGTKPVPLEDAEVEGILRTMGEDKPQPRVAYEEGSHVRVISGPFGNFTGIVEEVNLERGRLRVRVSMFGRETPVEFEFGQVEKID